MEMKYIIFKDPTNMPSSLEIGIIFPKYVEHNYIGNSLKTNRGIELISAGFCYIKNHYDVETDITELKCDCYGESYSLQLKSRPGLDTELMSSLLNTY